jgi:hypothetical protein
MDISRIGSIVAEPARGAQKGSLLADAASVYMGIINSVNVAYKGALKDAIGDLGDVNRSASKALDKVRLEEVKKSLNI